MGLFDEISAQAPVNTGKPDSYVGLSRKVVNQVRAKGTGQWQLAVVCGRELHAHRGLVQVTVDGVEAVFNKTDSHAIWLTKQTKKGQAAFAQLVDLLGKDLGEEANDKVRLSAEFKLLPDDDAAEA